MSVHEIVRLTPNAEGNECDHVYAGEPVVWRLLHHRKSGDVVYSTCGMAECRLRLVTELSIEESMDGSEI